MSSSILIVEDDLEVARNLQSVLDTEGYRSTVVHSLSEAKLTINSKFIDVVLLDINLSATALKNSLLLSSASTYVEEEGFELAAWMRDVHPSVRIIFLTGRKETASRIRGLDLGGDNYVTKPFDSQELKAVIRSTIRRIEGKPQQIEVFRKWQFDPKRKELTHLLHPALKPIRLTLYESNILSELLKANGSIVTRESLSKSALGRAISAQDRAVDTAISKLRAKLGESTDSHGQIVETVHGRGYRLNR